MRDCGSMFRLCAVFLMIWSLFSWNFLFFVCSLILNFEFGMSFILRLVAISIVIGYMVKVFWSESIVNRLGQSLK